MSRLRAILITLTVLLAAFSAVAQIQPPNAKSEASGAPVTGSITGRVVDESGQPLPNAVVSINTVGVARWHPVVATDREGIFRFNNLEAVPYNLSASMPSYIQPPRDPNSTAHPVATYKIGDNVMFTLIKGGVITGTVVSATGEPVVGISVRAQMIRDSEGRLLRSGFRVDNSTDDRGVYRIYGLPSGAYVVLAGGSPVHSQGNFNTYETYAPTYAPSSIREDASEINIRTGEEVTGIDIRYRSDPGRVVSGHVTLPPNAAGGIQVHFTTADEKSIPWSSHLYQQSRIRTFVFNGVADGDYYIYADANLSREEVAFSEPKLVKVRGADVTNIELKPKVLGSVAGAIVLERSKAAECAGKDSPLLQELRVAAWHKEDEAAKQVPQFFWSFGSPVLVDPEGKFRLNNLATGDYHFVARNVARYWYVQSILMAPAAKTGKAIDATRVWTNVKAGDRLTGLTITLAQGAATVRGEVLVNEGEVVPLKSWVYLVPAERERADEVLRFYGSPLTPERKFTLGNVAPGRYWVATRTETEDGAAPLTKLRLPHETEARARLRREAEAAKTEIELKPCQTVADYTLGLKPANPN